MVAAAPADAAPAMPAPSPQAAAAPIYRVELGTYATRKAASANWQEIARRLGERVAGREPSYERQRRLGDGKRFVLLRLGGFEREREAARFCRAAEARRLECSVLAPLARTETP